MEDFLNQVVNNNWTPSVLLTALISLIVWVSPKWFTARMTKSIQHEYDKKLANINAEINAKGQKLDLLASGALNDLSGRQRLLFEKQVQASELIWEDINSLGSEKLMSRYMQKINFDLAADEASKSENMRQFADELMTGAEFKKSKTQAHLIRPYVTPILWSLYQAYRSIVYQGVIQMMTIQHGVGAKMVNREKVVELVAAVLPHQQKGIDEFGPDFVHFCLEEIEGLIYKETIKMLDGKDQDQAGVAQAAVILKKIEDI